VIDKIGLSPSDRVLELGPGPGYFSVELARRIPEGRLESLDLQPEMLAKARRALDGAGYGHVG
jgi:predicted O-methyltransferase YrrM